MSCDLLRRAVFILLAMFFILLCTNSSLPIKLFWKIAYAGKNFLENIFPSNYHINEFVTPQVLVHMIYRYISLIRVNQKISQQAKKRA